MMNGFSNQQIIGGLVIGLPMTYAAFFVWLAESIGELRTELHSRSDGLDQQYRIPDCRSIAFGRRGLSISNGMPAITGEVA